MLAGEDDPARGSREPRAPEGIERRIEIRVAAPDPGILIPDDRPRRKQSCRTAEPFDPRDHAGRTLFPQDLLELARRAATGKEAQNRRTALLLVAVPDGPDGQIRSKREGPASLLPETPIELQQESRRRAIPEAGDRVVLRFRQARLEDDIARR